MFDSLKSALNRMRPSLQRHAPHTQPKSPRDTLVQAKPRAPYDPRQAHRTEATASRHKGGAGRAGAGGVHPAARQKPPKLSDSNAQAVTPEKLAASHAVLAAMRVDTFIGQMVACASCPAELACEPLLQKVQSVAMQSYIEPQWLSPWLTPLLQEAARDLCSEFSETTLRALAAFAKTEAGVVLFGVVPLLRVQLRYGESLGEPRMAPLCEDDNQALLACLGRIDRGLSEAIKRLPAHVMGLAWTRPFTPEVIRDIDAFTRRAEGRALVDYAQRACWLGIPNALVLQRDVWVAGVQSDMVSILQAEGISVPPTCAAMPMYVPSHVKIESVPANM